MDVEVPLKNLSMSVLALKQKTESSSIPHVFLNSLYNVFEAKPLL